MGHCQTFFFFILILLIYFIYFWLCWVFVAVHGLSLVAASSGYSSLQAWASHCSGFLCCGAPALGARASVVVAHRLSETAKLFTKVAVLFCIPTRKCMRVLVALHPSNT